MARSRVARPLILFVDRSLGGRLLPEALRALGRVVEVHDDHFAADAADTEWIPVVAAKGWVILTKDENIARNPLELTALLYWGARAFVLTSTRVTGDEQVEIFTRHLPRIEALARRKRDAFIARVNRTDVRIWRTGLRLT